MGLEINNIYNMDCIDGMKEIEDNSVDLIHSDPPFSIQFEEKQTYNRNHSLVIDDYKDINPDKYYEFSLQWMLEAKRILKPSGTMVIFSGYNRLVDVLKAGENLDLELVNQCIWKYQFGVNTTKKFITSHYNILIYAKNNKVRNFYTYSRFDKEDKTEQGGSARYADMESVWIINKENWTGCKKIPTKLPLEVCKKIIAYTTQEGDLIVDPFCGTGQAFWAAKEMDRNYIGFEIEKSHYKFAKERIDRDLYLIKD